MRSRSSQATSHLDIDNAPISAPRAGGYLFVKRAIDILVSILALAVVSPLLAVIAILIKLGSPGPVLYRGLRTGKHGEEFYILKLRSMYLGSDAGAGTTSRNDSRVTGIGRVLRRYKLDELPQFVNVLRGDMSLVGPRPELPRYTERYRGEERCILSVRPGITDFSSIEFSNLGDLIDDDDPDGTFEREVLARKNQLRVRYVREMSFLTDITLMWRTFYKLMRRAVCP